MSWLCERIYRLWKWLQMTADESGPLSESSAAQEPSLSESTSQATDLQPRRNVDERPIGRCHVEMTRLLSLVEQARAIDSQLKTALTAFWACRDSAAAEAYAERQEPFTTPLASAQVGTAATVFDAREQYLDWIERQLEAKQ